MPKDEWDPFQELVQLRKRFTELFEQSFLGSLSEDQGPKSHWTPPVDVYHDGNQVVVKVEIPGVNRSEVDIQFKGNQLVIRGTRSPGCSSGQTVFHRVERQHGPFERVLPLNEAISVDDIQAQYHDGVLTIELPLQIGPVERKIKLTGD
jgi:HSP20 family protein